MNRQDGLERELTVWLADVASPSVPDYTDDIVRLTAGLRQRPRWAFPERWLPMSVDALERVPTPPVPWRTIGLLAMIGLLMAALAVVGAGSAPKHPEPFGLAANGLIASARGGDIFTIDPATGTERALVTGPEFDREPRWSLDGTRLAFLREGDGGVQVVIVDVDVGDARLISSEGLYALDDDSLKWAPDGRSIVFIHDVAGARRIGVVDTTYGRITNLPVAEYQDLEVFWRPPVDGRELLFANREGGLSIVSMEGFAVREVPVSPESRRGLRAMGWTPDGTRILASHVVQTPSGEREQTSVIDVATGMATVLDVAFGHASNDGRRVVGLTTSGPETVCVVDIGGGRCDPIGRPSQAPWGYHGEGLQWSPDDEWILAQPRDDTGPPVVLDPDPDGTGPAPPSITEGAESWQREAP